MYFTTSDGLHDKNFHFNPHFVSRRFNQNQIKIINDVLGINFEGINPP